MGSLELALYKTKARTQHATNTFYLQAALMDAAPGHPLRLRTVVPKPKQLHFHAVLCSLKARNSKHTGAPPTITKIMLQNCFLLLSPAKDPESVSGIARRAQTRLLLIYSGSHGPASTAAGLFNPARARSSVTMQAVRRRQNASCHRQSLVQRVLPIFTMKPVHPELVFSLRL